MPTTYSITTYFFSELSKEAKKKALDALRKSVWAGLNSDCDYDFLWHTPRKWLDLHGVTFKDWQIGVYCHGYIKANCDDFVRLLITGYWPDKDALLKAYEDETGMGAGSWIEALEPFINCAHRHVKRALLNYEMEEIRDAQDRCKRLHTLFSQYDIAKEFPEMLYQAIQKDLEAEDEFKNTDEYLSEWAEANFWEFLEDGRLYS